MSEQTTESVRVPPVRPLSSISQLVDRLKCSRLQDDLPTTASVEPRTRLRRPHRPKAVNFTDEEACWINEAAAAVVTGSPSSPSTTASPATCDSGNEDSSEAWTGTSSASSSRAPGNLPASSSFSLSTEPGQFQQSNQHQHPPPLHQCLSTSAPDGPGAAFNFTLGEPCILLPTVGWTEPADDRKCGCCYCSHHQRQHHHHQQSQASQDPDLTNPPAKRSCRSQSVSYQNSTKQSISGGGGHRKGSIVRPIAVRLPQRTVYSPATTSGLSSTAHALVASGCVKLRNTTGHHQQQQQQLRAPSSRLSWHHPISSNSGIVGSGRTRFVSPAAPHGLLNSARHSVVYGDAAAAATNEMAISDVKLRKPPSLAYLSTSASNPTEFSHHRLSAFTPTSQSRQMSPVGGGEGGAAMHIPSFSPDAISSPCDDHHHPHQTPSLPHQPSVSAASSGFFQDSCSLSRSSFCYVEQQTSTKQAQDGKSQSDDSDDSYSGGQQFCEAKLRCRSQPAELAGVPNVPCCCCSCTVMASTECLSRQAPGAPLGGLKRRRCSQDVRAWEECAAATSAVNSIGFPFFPAPPLPHDLDALDVEVSSAASAPGFRQQGSELGFLPSDSLLACRREELSGLSEASEEEESNEHQQQRACCTSGEEYDAGTLTPPPPQTRFRPIAPSPEAEEIHHLQHNHHDSCSTEGSLCSFREANDNVVMPGDNDDEDGDIDDEDSFGGIAPGLSHLRRFSPMQTGEDSASSGKWRELDIGMIEQD